MADPVQQVMDDIAANIPGWTVGVNLFRDTAPAPDRLPDRNATFCVVSMVTTRRNGPLPTALGRPAHMRGRIVVSTSGMSGADAYDKLAQILGRYVSVVTILPTTAVHADSSVPVYNGRARSGHHIYSGSLTVTWTET